MAARACGQSTSEGGGVAGAGFGDVGCWQFLLDEVEEGADQAVEGGAGVRHGEAEEVRNRFGAAFGRLFEAGEEVRGVLRLAGMVEAVEGAKGVDDVPHLAGKQLVEVDGVAAVGGL